MENFSELVVNYWWLGVILFGLVIFIAVKILGNAFGVSSQCMPEFFYYMIKINVADNY